MSILSQILFWITVPFIYLYLKFGGVRARLLLISGDKALVVKGRPSDGLWTLPGGGVHRNESPEIGVIRELKEETGIEIDASKLEGLGEAKQRQHLMNFRYRRFVAEIPNPVTVEPRRWEISEIAWVPIEQLTTTNAQAHVVDTIAAWRAKA